MQQVIVQAPTTAPSSIKKSLSRIYEYSALEKDSFILFQKNYFDNYIPIVNDSALNLKDQVGVDTLGILAYSLLEDEFEHMYQDYKTKMNGNKKPEVYIYPIIKDTVIQGKKHNFMELAFLITDSVGANEAFYNFTHPCPPICSSAVDRIPYTTPSVNTITY